MKTRSKLHVWRINQFLFLCKMFKTSQLLEALNLGCSMNVGQFFSLLLFINDVSFFKVFSLHYNQQSVFLDLFTNVQLRYKFNIYNSIPWKLLNHTGLTEIVIFNTKWLCCPLETVKSTLSAFIIEDLTHVSNI